MVVCFFLNLSYFDRTSDYISPQCQSFNREPWIQGADCFIAMKLSLGPWFVSPRTTLMLPWSLSPQSTCETNKNPITNPKKVVPNSGKPFGLKPFVCTIATAMKAHVSLKVSNCKHGGMRCCNCSLEKPNVNSSMVCGPRNTVWTGIYKILRFTGLKTKGDYTCTLSSVVRGTRNTALPNDLTGRTSTGSVWQENLTSSIQYPVSFLHGSWRTKHTSSDIQRNQ